jgi:hypothetical protein
MPAPTKRLVYSREAQPREQPHRQPPRVPRDVQLGGRPSGQAPEQHRGRVGRDDHAADRHERHGQRDPHGAAGDVGAKQQGRGAPEHEGADERCEHPKQANAQRVVAGKGASRRDHPSDHGWMIQVAHGRRERPEAVVGLIVRQGGEARHQRTHQGEAQNGSHQCGTRLAEAARAACARGSLIAGAGA